MSNTTQSADDIRAARRRVKTWVSGFGKVREYNKAARERQDAETFNAPPIWELIYNDFGWVADMPAPKKRRLGQPDRPEVTDTVRQMGEAGIQLGQSVTVRPATRGDEFSGLI